MIEGLFAVRKSKFADHPAIKPELDLVDSSDQITHEISLDDELNAEQNLDVFKYDAEFVANEEAYELIKKEILVNSLVVVVRANFFFPETPGRGRERGGRGRRGGR